MLIVLLALIVAIILFATELLRVDMVAILIMTTLIVSGVLTPQEGLSGFSNVATATVAAMFVLSAAVQNTGILNPLVQRMVQAFQKSFWLGFLLMIVVAGFLSAFVNNTPVVALLIPVVIAASARSGVSPSKLLIPLSFISMFGGVCTLVGTSTNIIVSDVSEQYGYGPLGMFEMTSLGLVFFGAGILYMIIFGLRMLPDYGKSTDLEKTYDLTRYLTNIIVKREAVGSGKTLNSLGFLKQGKVEVVQLTRGKARYYLPPADFTVIENDVLKLRCDVEKIRQLQQKAGIEIRPLLKEELSLHGQEKLRYVEAIVSPGSTLVGRRFNNIDFRGRYHSALLGIRTRNRLFSGLMKFERVVSGDVLLLAVEEEKIDQLRQNFHDFILISEPDLKRPNMARGLLALSIVAAVIVTAAFQIVPILVSAIVGCILLVLTRCINAEHAYRSVEWKVIFLLAGAMSFGVAMQKTGLAELIANQMVEIAGGYGPIVLLSLVYLLTSLLTEAMSNNATVVLLAPIVIPLAVTLDVSPKPFLMAITFAASSSFITPIGYQTNTMVYAAGNYKFSDFFKVGLWLNILFWIIATLLIPVLFPF